MAETVQDRFDEIMQDRNRLHAENEQLTSRVERLERDNAALRSDLYRGAAYQDGFKDCLAMHLNSKSGKSVNLSNDPPF